MGIKELLESRFSKFRNIDTFYIKCNSCDYKNVFHVLNSEYKTFSHKPSEHFLNSHPDDRYYMIFDKYIVYNSLSEYTIRTNKIKIINSNNLLDTIRCNKINKLISNVK